MKSIIDHLANNSGISDDSGKKSKKFSGPTSFGDQLGVFLDKQNIKLIQK
jgi:hypothetical protein